MASMMEMPFMLLEVEDKVCSIHFCVLFLADTHLVAVPPPPPPTGTPKPKPVPVPVGSSDKPDRPPQDTSGGTHF